MLLKQLVLVQPFCFMSCQFMGAALPTQHCAYSIFVGRAQFSRRHHPV
jgi:hypothetical protein